MPRIPSRPPGEPRLVGIHAALARGDVPAFLSVLASDVHWTEAEGFPYGGIYSGPEAVLENMFMKLGTEWEGFSATPADFVTQGETVVVLGRYGGKFKATGRSIQAPFAHVGTLRGGKVVKFFQFTDTAVVRRALG